MARGLAFASRIDVLRQVIGPEPESTGARRGRDALLGIVNSVARVGAAEAERLSKLDPGLMVSAIAPAIHEADAAIREARQAAVKRLDELLATKRQESDRLLNRLDDETARTSAASLELGRAMYRTIQHLEPALRVAIEEGQPSGVLRGLRARLLELAGDPKARLAGRDRALFEALRAETDRAILGDLTDEVNILEKKGPSIALLLKNSALEAAVLRSSLANLATELGASQARWAGRSLAAIARVRAGLAEFERGREIMGAGA